MNIIKKLASDTAIYGIPSIVGRFINFLLVFFFAAYFTPELLAPQIEFYAYAAFFFVVLPHGMETAFFNFSRKKEKYKDVFATASLSVGIIALLFLGLVQLFRVNIAAFVGYPNNVTYVIWFGFILAIDAYKSIPYALLRYLNRPKRFAFIKSLGIVLNVGLNIFFIVFYPEIAGIERSIEYVFISNLIASAVELLFLLPNLIKNTGKSSYSLWTEMFKYSWPLIILGLAGMVNETFDRISMNHLLPKETAKYEIGVYGTFYRLSMIMTIFIQAFRYAAEPFFFAEADKKSSKATYSIVMDYFVFASSGIFLFTALFKSEIAHLLIRNDQFHNHPDALAIVPILLLANLFLGVFYNLSIWYKINDKTLIGAYISIVGAVITIALLLIFVPIYGFLAAAITTLIVYFVMVVISYVLGQKYYPIKYNLKELTLIIAISFILYYVGENIAIIGLAKYSVNALLLIVYAVLGISIINRLRKKIDLPL